MVSALDYRSNDPSSILGEGTALCSWSRHLTLIVPLFTQAYKWVSAAGFTYYSDHTWYFDVHLVLTHWNVFRIQSLRQFLEIDWSRNM